MEPTLGLADGFIFRAVGDCIMPFPLAARARTDGGLGSVATLLREATATLGNLETSLVDPADPGLVPRTVDDWCLSAAPAVGLDLATLGFDAMARANNHAMDWGVEGMRLTGERLDAAGLLHAGAGDGLAHARAPRYLDTSHGRVGVVSVYPTRRWDPDAALDPFGVVPGRPGVNALRLERIVTSSTATIAALRQIAAAIDPDGQLADDGDALRLDDSRFEEGTATTVRYEPDADDLASILRAIRLGAQHADLLVVTVHAHQEGPDVTTPPAYLRDLAHACIDAGAGVFVGHGVHRLWPVEVYRDRPIFYGLGNFVFSDVQEPVHLAMHRFARPRLPSSIAPEDATDADVNAAAIGPFFGDDRYFESIIAEVAWRDGHLHASVRSLDLRRGERLTTRGVPRLADPAQAADILKRLDEMSQPFGTSVTPDGVIATG